MRQIIDSFNVNEKKIIYLIFLIPIGILSGSLIINSLIIFIDIFFLYEIIKTKKYKFIKSFDLNLLLVIYVYLILNSLLIAENIDGYLRAFGFVRFIIFTFALAYYFTIENSKYFKITLKFWFVVFMIASFDIIFESIFGFNLLGFTSEYPGRLGGFTMDEYKIGGYFLGFVSLALCLFCKNNLHKIIFTLSFIFLIVAFLTGERSNFLKILLMIFIFNLFYDKKFLYLKLIYFLIFFSLLAFVFYLVPKDNPFKERFESRYISGIYKPINENGLKNFIKKNEHFRIYNNSINVFLDNKLFGIGIKQFRHKSYQDKYVKEENSQGSLHPHQIHFEFLAELGLIGYLIIMFLIVKKIFDGFLNFRKGDFYSFSAMLLLILTIIPFLPGGSFFTTYNASIFWVNYSIILREQFKKLNN